MADKSIPFSGPMVRALLDGRKTQTRRVIKTTGFANIFSGQWSDAYVLDRGNAEWRDRHTPYAVGDYLWVKEAWRTGAQCDHLRPSELPTDRVQIGYEADCGTNQISATGRYRHWLFMPRRASRLTLIVTDVRVQRLQDISDADAVAEGIDLDMQCCGNPEIEYDLSEHGEPINPRQGGCCGNPILATDPRQTFADLWNSLHGPDAWDQNPWVAAISFDVRRGNIDEATR